MYLFNGTTGALISTLSGSYDDDTRWPPGGDGGWQRQLRRPQHVLEQRRRRRADAGAVTWGSGTTGVKGAVSAANSLVGSTAND